MQLKFSFKKVVTPTIVLYVPQIRTNLVSRPVFNKNGLNWQFKSDKFVHTKVGMYVGKGYLANNLFKLNVMVVDAINMNKNASTYIVDSFSLQHARLRHVTNRCLYKMVNFCMLAKCDVNIHNKCEVCTESKFARQSFKSIQERSNEFI